MLIAAAALGASALCSARAASAAVNFLGLLIAGFGFGLAAGPLPLTLLRAVAFTRPPEAMGILPVRCSLTFEIKAEEDLDDASLCCVTTNGGPFRPGCRALAIDALA